MPSINEINNKSIFQNEKIEENSFSKIFNFNIEEIW